MIKTGKTKAAWQQVDFKEAKEILDTMPDCMILDVREEAEFITGHAVDAVLFTLADINERTAGEIIPSKETPLLVYCRSGRRSKKACEILAALGYSKLYDVGSLIGWPYGIE